jgi:hypothetical protein
MMTTKAEQILSRALREALADLPAGADVPPSEQFREALTALEYFIPEVLGEIHREWTFQGLDDVVPVVARKTGDGVLEIFGLCCIVSDQTLAPLHLRLQLAAASDEVSWFECRLGEQGPNGMVRKPGRFLREMTSRLRRLDGEADINWAYQVTYGARHL